MNVNDTEILNSILTTSGYERTSSIEEANVVFLVTVSRLLNESITIRSFHKLIPIFRSVLYEKMQRVEFGIVSSF